MRLLALFLPIEKQKIWWFNDWHPPIRRFASRTTIFRRALDSALFKGARVNDLKDDKPLLIINAADLCTGTAFYFTAKEFRIVAIGQASIHRHHTCACCHSFGGLPAFVVGARRAITL